MMLGEMVVYATISPHLHKLLWYRCGARYLPCWLMHSSFRYPNQYEHIKLKRLVITVQGFNFLIKQHLKNTKITMLCCAANTD